MPTDNKPAGPSPFEIVTPGKPKGAGKTGVIVGIVIVIFLILSVVAGVLLVRQQQTVSEKAVVPQCSAGAQQCPVANSPTHLRNCTVPQSDGSPDEQVCGIGRLDTTSVCGGVTFCCPPGGGNWTTNVSLCTTTAGAGTGAGTGAGAGAATATPTLTPTPTATASATPTLTPTPTGTSNGTGNACNGSCGSNSNCQSGLYCYSGSCRNPLCASDATCGCSSATGTPTATPTSASGATTQTTPLPIPVTGTDWPTYLGIGAGAAAIIVSLLLAL